MRPAVLGTLIGTVAGALLWSCSVHRVSEGYECSSNTDCASDRVCTQGYCIIGPRPTIDAPPRPIDAAVCPPICNGMCNFNTTTCMIVGTGSNVTCPPGWNCTIECATAGACGSITCSNALSCDITCSATDACAAITCTTADCKVGCTAQQACGNISCTSGDCTATCTGSAACGSISCTTGTCSETCSGGSAACGTLNCGTGGCSAVCNGLDPACGTVNCSSACKCDVLCNGTTNTCPATMNCPDRAPGAAYCTVDGVNGSRCSSTFVNQCNNC